jgi:anaerobic ribonucleoside-triphosphate reductase activating protein
MSLDVLLKEYGQDITCVAFMGGDATPEKVDSLAGWMRSAYPELKTAWYSGRAVLSDKIHLRNFDYIKLGPYIEAKGP